MNYSYPYSPQPKNKPIHPRVVSMLAGFGISFIIGILLGLLGSLFFSLINKNGGLEFLTIPLVIALLAGTTLICFFTILLIDKKINPVR